MGYIAAQEHGKKEALDLVDRRRPCLVRIDFGWSLWRRFNSGVRDIPIRIEPHRIRFALLGRSGDLPLCEPFGDDVNLGFVPGADPFPRERCHGNGMGKA